MLSANPNFVAKKYFPYNPVDFTLFANLNS